MTRWSDACRSSSASTIPWSPHWQPRRSALRKERALTSSKRRMRAAKPRSVPRPALIMCASAISKLKRTLVAVSILKFRHFNGAEYIPAWKVLAGEVPREDIEGRIILVGTSAPGLLDLRATPLDAAIPGIDIHAQVIEHLLTGQFSNPSRLCAGARGIHHPRVRDFARVAVAARVGQGCHRGRIG